MGIEYCKRRSVGRPKETWETKVSKIVKETNGMAENQYSGTE